MKILISHRTESAMKDNHSLFVFDDLLRMEYGEVICGVDEAGRGPLAGPVVCAAVILPANIIIEKLNDSKRMTKRSRNEVYDVIREEAVAYSVAFVDNKEIDCINILNATMKGMSKAIDSIGVMPDYIIIDGNRVPGKLLEKAVSVIKGDSRSASIAAASVIAKVVRDEYMTEMDNLYPQYCFAKHKGYPTKLHYEKIEKYGITEIHRISFLKGRI